MQQDAASPSLLGRYAPYLRGRRRLIVASVALSAAQTAGLALTPTFTQRIFDDALPRGDVGDVAANVGLLVAAFAASAALGLANRRASIRAVKSAVAAVRRDIGRRLAEDGRRVVATHGESAAHSRAVHDTERVDRAATHALGQFVPAALSGAALAAIAFAQNPSLAAAVALAAPAIYVVGRAVGRRLRAKVREHHRDYAAYSRGTSFALGFADLVALSSAEREEAARQERLARALERSGGDVAWLGALYATAQSAAVVAAGALVLLIGGAQVAAGATTLGALVSFYMTVSLLGASARAAIGGVPAAIEGVESLRALAPLLPEADAGPRGAPHEGIGSGIEMENVSFGYRDEETLRDVCLSVRPGEIVGLFGPSGAGKTTLVNLTLGLVAPRSGRVTVNGRDLREIDGASYRRRVGTLPQDPQIFSGSLRENLTYGLGDVPETELERVCQTCRLDDVVRAAGGYDAPVGERGAALSGGQRQRLALARAILKSPELLVLDEPDSHLDDDAADRLLEAVRASGVATIIVSHRPATRRAVDRALTLSDGHVHEEAAR